LVQEFTNLTGRKFKNLLRGADRKIEIGKLNRKFATNYKEKKENWLGYVWYARQDGDVKIC
jgi:hypothetical protein